jgi:hypothetical protein
MVGFQLYQLDVALSGNKNLRYVRYMDDFIILAKTRWHLRLAVKQLNGFLLSLALYNTPTKLLSAKSTKALISWGIKWQ